MNLVHWLKKLGILSCGSTSATYKNAIERPIELQSEDDFSESKKPEDKKESKSCCCKK
ncbi:MAG: hypothetical protein IT292_00050 [Deltaproteobacteria bacterium]|nr:hypothetical protein [Deltaproteobacteria bacterium]